MSIPAMTDKSEANALSRRERQVMD
ncbi:MAG: hypothetical protein JWM95_2773, partial [Gemmatimonadetes bacterium]|nr:hypothetical protein [Gemmatimonadota bacterium]